VIKLSYVIFYVVSFMCYMVIFIGNSRVVCCWQLWLLSLLVCYIMGILCRCFRFCDSNYHVNTLPFFQQYKLHLHVYVLAYEHLKMQDNVMGLLIISKYMLSIELRNMIVDVIDQKLYDMMWLSCAAL